MTKHICAILWKQLKDTLKNKTILIQFVMFPALTLIMENVKPAEYLIGVGIYIWIICMIGVAIGTWSKNQMMATSVTVPVMMVFSFLPMLSMFNVNKLPDEQKTSNTE